MDEIGSTLKEARESSGVSLSEASKDLEIKEIILENIEAGKIGAFKDVFELKGLIHDYAKYLGLEEDKMIDDFNEYLFEYTSKIPVKELEKTIEMQLKEEETEKIVSPYTKKITKYNQKYYILIYLIIILLIIIAMIWAVKQVTIGNHATNVISYKG